MLNSSYQPLVPVSLPWRNRQKYMHEVDISSPTMPEGFEDYLEPVSALLKAAKAGSGTAYMTVDERKILPGMSQRRPKPHVDGHFSSVSMGWNHPGPSWNHVCNNLPVSRMSVIVAASIVGCRVWKGLFDAEPKSDGDLSHIEDQLGRGTILGPNFGYLLSPDCVHESMIFKKGTERTFLRLALPVHEHEY